MMHRLLRRSLRVSRMPAALPLMFLTAATSTAVSAWPEPQALAADPFGGRAERMTPYGRTVASDNSSEALVLNPANLGNRGGLELRWSGMRCTDTQRVACGHALSFTTPLFFGFSTGLRVDYMLPPGGLSGVQYPFNATSLHSPASYTWLTWGLSYRLSERFSFGGTLAGSYSQNSYLNGLVGLTLAATYMPNRYMALAGVAHDFNNPQSSGGFQAQNSASVLGRSYVGSLALRPTGTRALEIGVEAKYLEDADEFRPKLLAGVDIPGFGRARADVELGNVGSDRGTSYVASAGLEFALDKWTAGAGAFVGTGLGATDAWGQFATASYSPMKEPGIHGSDRAVYIRLEDTPGTRTHVRLLRTLWRLAEDDSVKLVAFVPRTEIATSFAHAEELADAIRVLHAHGKKTLCSFEDAGPKTLYVCANATKTVITPAGGVRYSGLHATRYYLKGLLDKIGVKAEFVRIGAHKSAPEQFTETGPTAVAKADQEDFLRQQEAVFVRNLALYRKISEKQVRESSLKGPFIASEARDAKFVDGYAFDDELDKVAKEMVGRPIPYLPLEADSKSPQTFGPRPKLGMLYVDGDMVDGRSQTVPILGTKMVGSYTIQDAIKALREDNDVRAVVLRIESPGGSSLSADVMWRELKKLNERKPLIVSMGSIAASGGYYIATAGREIHALPLTVTGSIGIFYGKADVSEMLSKLGVTTETSKTTPRADAESFFRGFSDEERVELDRKVAQFYDVFVGRVAEGRHMTKAQVDAVGQGRVWAGQQALQNHLVDKMGGLRQALDAARAAGGLPDDAPIVEYPEPKSSLLDKALELAGMKGAAPRSTLPAQFQSIASAIAPLAIYPQDIAMARLEWVALDEGDGHDE